MTREERYRELCALDSEGRAIPVGRELETLHLSDSEVYSMAGFVATFVHASSAGNHGIDGRPHIIVGPDVFVAEPGDGDDVDDDPDFCSINRDEFAWIDPDELAGDLVTVRQDGLVWPFRRVRRREDRGLVGSPARDHAPDPTGYAPVT